MTAEVFAGRDRPASSAGPAKRPVREEWFAPCAESCPVGIDLPRVFAALRGDAADAALALLLGENPLPAATGRLCEHPCERACHRSGFDEAVSVRSVERMLGDLVAERPPAAVTPRDDAPRAAVVGAGPAGLTAAWHLARLGWAVELFDDQPEPGGWLRWGVPEFRLPASVLAAEVARIERAGVAFHPRTRIGQDRSWDDLSGTFAAVVVATGSGRPRLLGIDGEDGAGILTAAEFLRRARLGDPPTLGRRVAVAGDGPEALDAARTARRLGAEVVVVTAGTVPAIGISSDQVDSARREGVLFSAQAVPQKARLADGLFAGLECLATDRGEERRFFLAADALVVAAGEEPDATLLPEGVEAAPHGLAVDLLGTTSRPGLFAAGGAAGSRDLASAIGSGKRAALGVDSAGRPDARAPERFGPAGNLAATRPEIPPGSAHRSGRVVPFDRLETAAFLHSRRHPDRRLPVERTLQTFEEVDGGLPREVAIREAARCFICGQCTGCETCLVFCPEAAVVRSPDGRGFVVDEAHCRGCGICRAECPRGCVTLVPADGDRG